MYCIYPIILRVYDIPILFSTTGELCSVLSCTRARRMKLITLNIERNEHYDTVAPFLIQEQADVVCLQEVFQKDLEMLARKSGYTHTDFTPMMVYQKELPENEQNIQGHAILSKLPIDVRSRDYYYLCTDSPLKLPLFDRENIPGSANRAVTFVKIFIQNEYFIIGNTHFTWTPDGLVDNWQREDIPHLLEYISKYPNLILCGDFNAPRGMNETWNILSRQLTDNLPTYIDNTLDPNFHRVPDIKRAVDGIFTTPSYSAQNVRMHCGVSDHCALISDIVPIFNQA